LVEFSVRDSQGLAIGQSRNALVPTGLAAHDTPRMSHR
jgi:hypothetical protein